MDFGFILGKNIFCAQPTGRRAVSLRRTTVAPKYYKVVAY